MNTPEAGAPPGQQTSQFYSVLDYFKAHVTAITTLATGALVLSLTFLKDLDLAALQLRGFLQAGWILFTVSIVAGVCYSFILTYIAKDPDDSKRLHDSFKQMLVKLSFVLHFAFMLGIICFLVFAMANIGARRKDSPETLPPPARVATPHG